MIAGHVLATARSMRRSRSRRLAVGILAALPLAVALSLAVSAAAFAAPRPGTHGWYWPVARESFAMDGFFVGRPGSWHLAQDMGAPYGAPVYAIADGKVLESKYVDHYGPGGGKGGAVVILHKTAEGREFWALYGHLNGLRYPKGATVRAGAVIGRVNGAGPSHLHFGIHPGRAYPSDNNPYRGHTYTRSNRYGYVDPVKFMRTYWRVLPYKAPPVPVVLRQPTDGPPLSAGAAAGVAYWSLPESAEPSETAWWQRPLPSGLATRLADGASPPEFDVASYVLSIEPSGSASPGFTVSDRRPRLRAVASPATPASGRWIAVSGALTNAAGRPFQGARVLLQRKSGVSWAIAGSVTTGVDGRFSLSYRPAGRSTLRVLFAAPQPYISARSSELIVVPRVALSRPSVVMRGRYATVSGTLLPRHPDSSVVLLQFDRLERGRWVRRVERRAALVRVGPATEYAARVRIGSTGSWRVRAVAPADGAHATTATARTRFTAP